MLSFGVTAIWAHASPKLIYIAPDDHTDYFWKGDEETYRQAFLEMIDYYLDLADATDTEPLEYQSRWNCDGSYWIWTYEKNRSAADFERLIGRIKDGHISFPLNALVVSLGGAPTEAILRGMYYAGTIERRYDLRVPLAISMENQTLPFGLGGLWSGAGAKYSWKGICRCDSQVFDAWDREHEIYWMVGADGSRVLMKWNSMLAGNQNIGGYAEARNPAGTVEFVDTNAEFEAVRGEIAGGRGVGDPGNVA
jgi:alpha-mannosidase